MIFPTDGNAAAAVRAGVIHEVNGSRVMFRVPGLVRGSYKLSLPRAFGSEIREGEHA
jgi:hypothetical protein